MRLGTRRETPRKATDILKRVVVELGNALVQHTANQALRRKVSEESLAPSDFMSGLVMLCFRHLMFSRLRAECLRFSDQRLVWTESLSQALADASDTERWARCLAIAEAPFFERLMPVGTLYVDDGEMPLAELSCSGATVNALLSELTELSSGGQRLGVWYESLLSYTPSFMDNAFALNRHKGYGRKSAGAYYTPGDLVEFSVFSALDEVCATRGLANASKIRICDPACGDGQFLIKALERLRALNVFDASDEIGYVSSLYGVDVDPQAVELTRFNLSVAVGYAPSAAPLIAKNIRLGNALLSGWAPQAELSKAYGSEDCLDLVLENQVPAETLGCQPFHWQLEFRAVFAEQGGFDLIIGNPPWEKLEVIEREYFAGAVPELVTARGKGERAVMLEKLANQRPQVFARYQKVQVHAESIRRFVKESGCYPLSAHGRLNTYRLFTELALRLIQPTGQVAFFVPTGILTDYSTRHFVSKVLSTGRLRSVLDFDNRSRFFPEVQGNVQFCLLRLSNERTHAFTVCTRLRSTSVEERQDRSYALTADRVRLMNPQTMAVPMFSSAQDSEIVGRAHGRFNAFGDSDWGVSLRQGTFNMTTSAGQFKRTFAGDDLLPLYEAKLCQQFNHRHATFDGTPKERRYGTHAWANRVEVSELRDVDFEALPRYWVDRKEVERRGGQNTKWLLVVRNAFSALADARSLTSTIIPKCGVGNSLTILESSGGVVGAAILTSLLNSFMLDYIVREKSTGSNLNFYVLRQLPMPERKVFTKPAAWTKGASLGDWVVERSLELTFTSKSLKPYALGLGFQGQPYVYSQSRRREIRAELDAAVFLLFGISRASVEHVLEAFPVLRRREIKAFGEYASKGLVLSKYDEFRQVGQS